MVRHTVLVIGAGGIVGDVTQGGNLGVPGGGQGGQGGLGEGRGQGEQGGEQGQQGDQLTHSHPES